VTVEQIIGLALALALMLVGVAGTVLPGIPSTPVILAAAIAHKLYFGATGVGALAMTLLVALTLFSALVDYLATVCGAKRLGATWRGGLGAVLGALAGLFFGLVGVLVGPFLGALLLELVGGRSFRDSSRAGVGATIGLLAGAVGKLACCLAMIGVFVVNVLYRSVG
jgi:hypothetical protein